MNKKQKGLGKGMDAILPYEAKFSEIAIADIETNPFFIFKAAILLVL